MIDIGGRAMHCQFHSLNFLKGPSIILALSPPPLQTIAWYASQANNLFCDRRERKEGRIEGRRLVLRFRYHAIKQGTEKRGRRGEEGLYKTSL